MNRFYILKRQLSFGLTFRVLSMGLSYISISLLFKFLGKRDYGVWITIFSIINWIYVFDLGIGNGLRNKLNENLINKNYKNVREYITTGYIILSIIAFFVLCLVLLLMKFINITKFLNITFYNESYIKLIFILTFSMTVIDFVLSLYQIFYLSVHKSFIRELTGFIFQVSIILFLCILNYFNKVNIVFIAVIYPGIRLLIGLSATIEFFKKYSYLRPNFNFFKKEKIKEIKGLGISFFIIQISMLIILTTDNILITKYISTTEVATYNIVSKLFQIFFILEGSISAPIWTMFIDTYIKKDKEWIKKAFINLNLLFLALIFGVIIMIYTLPYIVKIWMGQELIYPKYLILFWGVFILNKVYGDIYIIFINATEKIKIQMYLYILGAIINIPLTIYFIKNLNMGSSGAILATNICILPLTIMMPVQTYRILKKIQ